MWWGEACERARPAPVTVSLAPWLTRTLAMLEATQWKTPLSSARRPVICRTPLGSSVYLWWGARSTTSSAPLAQGCSASRTQSTTQPLSQSHFRHRRHTLGLSLVDAPAIPASATNNHTPTFSLTHVLHLGPQATQILSLNKVAGTPPRGCRQAFFKAQALDWACLLVMPTQGSPLIVRVNGDPVLLPGDEGFGEPVDLALEAGHTALLAHGSLRMHVEV